MDESDTNMFLFQTGSIKSEYRILFGTNKSRFYSRLVRLKADFLDRGYVRGATVSIPDWFD